MLGDCFAQLLTDANFWKCYWLDQEFYRFLTVPRPPLPPPPEPRLVITGDAGGEGFGGTAPEKEFILVRDIIGSAVDLTGTATGAEFIGDAEGQSV